MFTHPLMLVFVALLFVVLTPGVVLSIPPKGSLMMKAAVHAVVFALVYHYTQGIAFDFLY
jgi:hypothetical protein